MNPGLIPSERCKSDIVVVGGGGTGLSAALTAAEKGARVILLEKRNALGGTSVFANGLLAAESPVQRRMSVAAFKDDAFKLAMDYSHWSINPEIVRAFIEKSGDTIQWLENQGLHFGHIKNLYPGLDSLVFHGLESAKKTGAIIVETLQNNCEKLGVQLLLNSPAKKILTGEKGEIKGILATRKGEEFSIQTKSVIIGTGGYTGNQELLKKYYSDYSENIEFLGIPNMGDGLLMANEIGAANEGLGVLLLHPHYYRGSVRVDALAQEPFTIWLNKKGKRFVNEAITFSATECGNAVNRQLDKCVYVLFDEKIKSRIEKEGFLRGGIHGQRVSVGVKLNNLASDLQPEVEKGGVKISDYWDRIAEWMGIESDVLKSTIGEYNRFCNQGYDEIFNKDRRYLSALHTPPYYAIRCFLSCLDTIGGIKINHHMEVLDHLDNPIPGLYAGGDATGGWESDTYCILLPGSAFGFAINSGCIAGENSVKYVLD